MKRLFGDSSPRIGDSDMNRLLRLQLRRIFYRDCHAVEGAGHTVTKFDLFSVLRRKRFVGFRARIAQQKTHYCQRGKRKCGIQKPAGKRMSGWVDHCTVSRWTVGLSSDLAGICRRWACIRARKTPERRGENCTSGALASP